MAGIGPSSSYNEARHKRQLRGWLTYAFASEVFVIVSLTLFLPICLEQFARDNGYLLPEKTQPCSLASANSTRIASPQEENRCVVKIAWLWIDSASFSLYVYSASVALQALTVISMGNIADHPPHRKRLLLGFAALGSFAAMLFFVIPSSSPVWFLAAPLAICANVGFGASIVALNAYLPFLARGTHEVVAAREALEQHNYTHAASTALGGYDEELVAGALGDDTQFAAEPLLPHDTPSATDSNVLAAKLAHDNALSSATARISGHGIALGYAAGIFMLLLALIPVRALGGSTFALRLAIGLSGVWWAVFSIPAALWLPGASAIEARGQDTDEIGQERETKWSARREIAAAWKRLGGMLRWREVKKLSNTFKYLAAWFLLSDGFSSISSTAMLFGKTSLNMPPSSLIVVGALAPSAGIFGSLVWPIIQRRMGWTNKRVLVILLVLASLVPAYGCLGFLPIFQHSVKFGGLTTPGEMFVLAVYFGFILGAFQGYARAFYAELIPPGEEARWYGLFSITDKSSSFIGPLIVGLIADTTGNIRYAFFFLVFMVWSAVPFLAGVDVERGREDARAYRYGSRSA